MSIDSSRRRAQEKILAGALNPIRPWLPDAFVNQWCHKAQHESRACVWGPMVTLLACVWKQLQASASARQVEDWVASFCPAQSPSLRDGSDFCAARARLPLTIFESSIRHVGENVSASCSYKFHDLPVWLLDGTTLRTPNTSKNEAAFGRGRNAARASRSPILRLLILVCAGSGAVLDMAFGPFVTSEIALLWQMISRLPAGGLLIADRGFSSYLSFALVARQKAHLLSRHHATRHKWRVRRFSQGDEIREWSRPQLAYSAFPQMLQSCPKTLLVRVVTRNIRRRGYRDWKLVIVTTLLDYQKYNADDLVEFYLRRWDVETTLRTLKTDYKLAHLTTKTPAIIAKEICATVLAHNLVAALQVKSGEAPRLLSPTRARRSLLIYCERMATAETRQLPKLFGELLALIKTMYQLPQERAPQPRAIVQRPSTYPVLMTTRQAWRAAYYVA